MASLVLCEQRDGAYVRFYPIVRYGPVIDATTLDVTNGEVVLAVRRMLLDRGRNSKSGPQQDPIARCMTEPYRLFPPDAYNLNRMLDFWNAIDVRNVILLRGVYALIKADMLCCHYEFFEEAIITLYIALECSFQLVLRRLADDGVSNPRSHDAAAAVWLHHHFNEPFGFPEPDDTETYFQEFHEDRVMTIHPASRFGDLPYAPIMHDDFFELRRSLREIFAYLLLRKHTDDYFADLYKSRR